MSRLKLNYSMAKNAIDYEIEKSNTKNTTFDLDYDTSLDTAASYLDDSDLSNVHVSDVFIGFKDFHSDNVFAKFIPVDDMKFARVLLNICHEQEHVRQSNEYFQSQISSDEYKRQAIEYIARFDNAEYYEDNGNYHKNSNEIEAERAGFLGLRKYMRDNLKHISIADKDAVILDLMNEIYKENNGDYYIKPEGEKFQSLDEIEDAFNKAYKDSFNAKKRYFILRTQPEEKKNRGLPPDAFKEYVKTDKKARSVYEHARTREEQDLVVAAINCKLHPEYKHYFKCLENVDLSYEHVIEERYAELVNEGKVEPDKIYERKYEEAHERLFGDNEPVKVFRKKASDKKDLRGMSRSDMADELFGHLMQEENCENELEK